MEKGMTRDDGFTEDTTELARCAQVNVDNLARMAPALAAHPIYAIAKAQLDAVVARLEAADDAEEAALAKAGVS